MIEKVLDALPIEVIEAGGEEALRAGCSVNETLYAWAKGADLVYYALCRSKGLSGEEALKGVSSKAPLKSYALVRCEGGASHEDFMEVWELGIDVYDYADGRRNYISHSEMLDAWQITGEGELASYVHVRCAGASHVEAVTLFRGGVDLFYAAGVLRHGGKTTDIVRLQQSGISTALYLDAIRNGVSGDDLHEAWHDGRDVRSYLVARTRGTDHLGAMKI